MNILHLIVLGITILEENGDYKDDAAMQFNRYNA